MKRRTRVLSTRLKPEEQELFLARAQQRGISPAEYMRTQLMGDDHQTVRVLVAELREMRTICLEMQAAALAGKLIDTAFIRAVAEHAAQTKFTSADEILKQAKVNLCPLPILTIY